MLLPLGLALAIALLLLAIDGFWHRTWTVAPAPAGRLLAAARAFSLLLLAGGLVRGVGTDLAAELPWLLLFAGAGLLAYEAAAALGLAALRGILPAALQGNAAAGTAAAAHLAAIGILLANVCAGRSFAELGVAMASFAVGQATLLLLLWLFRCLTAYDDRAELLSGNVAVALAHGGLTLALALLIAHASDGEYTGPLPALEGYAVALGEGLLVYPLRQVVVTGLMLRHWPSLRGGELDRAIAEDREIGTGALEGVTYLAAVLLVRSLA
jgi:uncharacterized membrane protein YjfL (UPF0719 family)